MFRLAFLLALLPTLAAADWAPRPGIFNYDAVFDQCVATPDAPDLAADCADLLTQAYVLKRAVAQAVVACFPTDLAACPGPFEDEGLPAIAAEIAVSSGCEAADLRQMPDNAAMAPYDCAVMISDILFDEGVVPLNTDIACGVIWIECGELAQRHAAFWTMTLNSAAMDDPEAQARIVQMFEDCDAISTGGWAEDLDILDCKADGAARLWSDLVLAKQDQ